jgi:hypothetical protein
MHSRLSAGVAAKIALIGQATKRTFDCRQASMCPFTQNYRLPENVARQEGIEPEGYRLDLIGHFLFLNTASVKEGGHFHFPYSSLTIIKM